MFSALLDLVLPHRCVGCGRVSVALCPACGPDGPPFPAVAGGLPVVAAAAYEASVRAALLAYKERGRRDLARPLGLLLGAAVDGAVAVGRAPPGAVVLVPVPSGRAVAAARGGDHVLRLARRAGAASGRRVAPGVLRMARTVADSAGLGVAERRANLDAAMVARDCPSGGRPWSALVVDDIVTTGATLREATRALTAAGWPVVGAAVVAATPLQRDRRVVPGTGQPPASRSSVGRTFPSR